MLQNMQGVGCALKGINAVRTMVRGRRERSEGAYLSCPLG